MLLIALASILPDAPFQIHKLMENVRGQNNLFKMKIDPQKDVQVARFKYPPHWVPVSLLYKAMADEDEASGLCRGFLKIGNKVKPPSLLFTISIEERCVLKTSLPSPILKGCSPFMHQMQARSMLEADTATEGHSNGLRVYFS